MKQLFMHNKLTILIISTICLFQRIQGMNSRVPSCVELAAHAVSKLCNPEQNYESALQFLQSNIVNHDIAGAIHQQLRKLAHNRLEEILENQTPQKVVILKKPSKKLSPTKVCLTYQLNPIYDGHYPHHNCHKDYLLIPDPVEKQDDIPYCIKPTINADKTLWCDEQKVYDARTNALISDCSIMTEKIKALYPDAQKLKIFSIAPNNTTAWAEVKTNNHHCICAFRIDNHDVLMHVANRCFSICYTKNGQYIVARSSSSLEKPITEIYTADTAHKNATTNLPHFFWRAFALSPALNYMLYFNLIDSTQICFGSKLGRFKPLPMTAVSCVSRDGKFLASSNTTWTVIFDAETEKKTEIPSEIKTESSYVCFSPDAHYLYIYNAIDADQPDILKIYDLKSMNMFATLPIITEKNKISNPLIFCNDYNYLFLPRGQLLLSGHGFAKHTTLPQLIALLIAEHHHARNEKIPKATGVKEILGTLKIKNYLQERINKYQFE
jgi:hypothetical protein